MDEDRAPTLAGFLRERSFSFSTLDVELRAVVVTSWVLLATIPLLLVFRGALGPATIGTELSLNFSRGALAAGVLLVSVSLILVLSGAMMARPIICFSVLAIFWLATTLSLMLPVYTAIYGLLFDRQEMPDWMTITRTTPWFAVILATMLAVAFWIAARRAQQRSLKAILWPCAVILFAFWGAVRVAGAHLGVPTVMASSGVKDLLGTTLALQVAALWYLATPAFMVTGQDFAEWWGILGERVGESLGKWLHEPFLWAAAAVVALVCATAALSGWWRPSGADLWIQGSILVTGALVIYLVYVSRRTTWSLILPHLSVPYAAIVCAAAMFIGVYYLELPGVSTQKASGAQFVSNNDLPFTMMRPAGWESEANHYSDGDRVSFYRKGEAVSFYVLRVDPLGPDITMLDQVDGGFEPTHLNFPLVDPDTWSATSSLSGVRPTKGPPRVVPVKFIAWRRVEGSQGRKPGTTWYLVGTSLPATFAANSTRFLKMRDSWSLHTPDSSPSSNEVAWLLLAAVAAALLLVAPRTRLSRDAERTIWFVLVLAVFLAVRNSGMSPGANLPAMHSAVVDAWPLDARAMSVVQIAVAVGTLGAFLWYAAPGWRHGSGRNIPTILIGFNLALLFTRLFAGWFRSASQLGDTAITIAAVLMVIAFGWEILVSGHSITNQNSDTMPRRARVLMYFGYILFVATGIFFFAPQQWQGIQIEGASTEGPAAAGIVLLGFPWVMTVFAGRLMVAVSTSVGETRPNPPSRRARWAIRLFAAALVGVAAYIALWAGSRPYMILAAPGALETKITNISGSGRIVGSYMNADLSTHGFAYYRGRYTPVEWGGPWDKVPVLQPSAINDAGQIVGSFDDADQLSHGFLATADGKVQHYEVPESHETELDGINSYGDFAVTYLDGHRRAHGLLVARGSRIRLDFPGAVETFLTGISNRGELAGDFTDANGNPHGFYWAPLSGVFDLIDYPGASETQITAVGPRGAVVGIYYGASGRRRGLFIWYQGKFDALDAPVDNFEPSGVDAARHVVGTYVDDLGRKTGLILYQRTPGALWRFLSR